MGPQLLALGGGFDVVAQFTTILELAEKVVKFIQDNSVLALFLGASLVPTAFRVFRSAKKSAK